MKCVKYVVLLLVGFVVTPMSIPAYTTDPAVTALENALLASSLEALLTVIAPSVTVIGPADPAWFAHTPPKSGVVDTRGPSVEKSSLTRTVAEAAASRAWTREIRSILAFCERTAHEYEDQSASAGKETTSQSGTASLVHLRDARLWNADGDRSRSCLTLF